MRALFPFLFFSIISTSCFSQLKVKPAEVADHIGDSVVVEGKATEIKYMANEEHAPTFINIGGANSKNSLTIIIWGVDRIKFSVMPEETYKNKMIRITGRVLNTNGKPEIVIHDPSQIILLDKK